MKPLEKLQQFLEKEGLVINAIPQFVPTNHGSFEIAVQVVVREKEKPQEPPKEAKPEK